jgi:hypothetical protein
LIVWNVLASVVLVDVTQDRSVEDGFTEPVDFVARGLGAEHLLRQVRDFYL